MKLTWSSLAYRSLWELDRRSGFKALRTPRGAVPIPSAVPSFDAWLSELGASHRLRRLTTERPPIPWRAGGAPGELDWHLEPHTGKHWPARQHWTTAIDAPVGDLRLTWERNRFAHVWEWIADDVDAADAFREQLRHWRRHNPFRSGVNWASGQELAVRSLAWMAGAAVYGRDFDDASWRDLVELLYWHGVQIDAEFGFARHSVRNNHVIAEALALAALGDAFAGFDEASTWRRRGLASLAEAVDEQFFDDGGYCQCSHAYHHFALQLLVEAWDWFDELHDTLRGVFERSTRFFEAIVEAGRVPNFGPNDRVLEPDFVALLDAMRSRTALPQNATPSAASFDQAGVHVVRVGSATVTLRCGALPDRSGHDDGLHVELWFDGEPVAIDAGSYLYSGRDRPWFDAHAHNVCIVDGQTPRERVSRFTWDRVALPHLSEFDAPRGLLVASYDDAFDAMTWERELRVDIDAVDVIDQLNGLDGTLRRLRIHWLLDATVDDIDVQRVDQRWTITTPRARLDLGAEPLIGSIEQAELHTTHAWASPTYGTRVPVTSLALDVVGRAVRFRTRVTRR